MAGETDISICSKALLRLGETTITSFDEDNDRATICANTWPHLKNVVLLKYPWKRTRRKKTLNRLSAAPLNEYAYAYQMPSDRLGDMPIQVTSGATVSPTLVTDYEIFDDKLFTDATDVVIDYQVEIEAGQFAPHLVELSILALAAEIAIPITDSLSLSEKFERRAWGLPSENGQGGYYRSARQLDATGEPPEFVEADELIIVRNEGGG